jgi:hypothetical protein
MPASHILNIATAASTCDYKCCRLRWHDPHSANPSLEEQNGIALVVFPFWETIYSTIADFCRLFPFITLEWCLLEYPARLHKHLCSSLGSGKFESGDSLEHVNEMARQSQRSRKSKTVRRERHLSRLRKRLGVESLLEIKRKAIQKALTASKGDKVLAAALLGIGKTTLYRSLKK